MKGFVEMKEKINIKSNELMVISGNELDLRSKIYEIRGQQVMLDRDLAAAYRVSTTVFNQAVKRNANRFPDGFRFQLTKAEHSVLMSQIVISKHELGQETRGGYHKLPYAFTEQGIAMLSGVLKSDVAVSVSIRLMNTFVAMRKTLASMAPVMNRLEAVERRQIADQSHNEERFEVIFKKMSESDVPKQQLFFQGQFWDAKSLLVKLIRKAKKELILIDAYVGTDTLDMLSKRNRGVKIEIITHSNRGLAESDYEAFGRQYGKLTVTHCGICHDRALIIDGKEMYAIGASLKDAGRETFCVLKASTGMASGLLANLRNAVTLAKEYAK